MTSSKAYSRCDSSFEERGVSLQGVAGVDMKLVQGEACGSDAVVVASLKELAQVRVHHDEVFVNKAL